MRVCDTPHRVIFIFKVYLKEVIMSLIYLSFILVILIIFDSLFLLLTITYKKLCFTIALNISMAKHQSNISNQISLLEFVVLDFCFYY